MANCAAFSAQHQKVTKAEACASTEHERNRSIFEDFCSSLRNKRDSMFNNNDSWHNTFKWDEAPSDDALSEFEDVAIRHNGPRKASAMMHLTPATTAQRIEAKGKAESKQSDLDSIVFDMELLTLDC